MPKKHLTDIFVRKCKPQDKRVEYYDQHLIKNNDLKAKGVKGLLLRVTKAGNKYFYYSYWYDNKSKRYKIGNYPNIGISEARDAARELARQVNDGVDPQEEKNVNKDERPATFEYLVNQYKKKHMRKLKESTQKTYTERIDGEMLPAFKDMKVKNMNRRVIINLLEEIATERKSPYQSNRVRAILSSMFTFGVQREIAEYNPVKSIKPLGKETKRERVLTEDEIRSLWDQFKALREPTQSLFKLLLSLGQRLGETRKMKWDDINGDVWTIPKELTKAKRTHYVPLPPRVIELIENLENNSDYVFNSPVLEGQPIKSIHTAFHSIRKRADVDDIRIHDLRRTAATYMAELGTERTILGKILNHKGLSGDSQVTARYDRHGYMSEKRQALNRWCQKLNQIIEGEETNNHKMR